MKEFADYAESDLNIKDPWGCSYDAYKRCAKEIDECIDKIIQKI